MKFHERENKMDIAKLNQYSNYWESVRAYYYAFESGLKAGTGDVYRHEIPGGQYSNLKPQAEGLGLADRFHEITEMYSKVNTLFGDIIKVTPSSKVVGDMAQYLVSNNLTIEDVKERGDTISFPSSVVSLFKGELGQPVGGFPKALQELILKDQAYFTNRPNEHLEPVDFQEEYQDFVKVFKKGMGRELDITDFLSYKLYPQVFTGAYNHHLKYGSVINIPTKNFFYGMVPGEEIIVELDHGKILLVELISVSEPNEEGKVTVFFKVNGQTRNAEIQDNAIKVTKIANAKTDKVDALQIGAPLQGALSSVLVKTGQEVRKNQPLFVIEAMKMETTITANEDATIKKVVLQSGVMVEADDLVILLE